MTFAVWTPRPLALDLRTLGDSKRRILFEDRYSRAVWSLKAIQEALVADPPLRIIFTTKAQQEMFDSLKWRALDMRAFLAKLTTGRYNGSEWCYSPGHTVPHACDSYVMGFNRHTGEENPNFQPWAYVKFGFIGPDFRKLAVFSAHPEGQYREVQR